ncbi:DnaD domain-containing protein [Paenibacillus amylolyticus]|uniref:DnaD domain-containing protein n=1 Tax=Paenibacillus amylolyticus TaxID=1451 RepID=UPI003D95F26B
MAVYRQIQVSFWQDPFVISLTPEEKYFYLYLMTNSKTTQCGIYELPKRIVEFETGYHRETVDKLLERFVQYGKVLYNDHTQEIMLVNWLKYNSIKSPKVRMCVEKELQSIKNTDYLYRFGRLCKDYGYPIPTLSIDLGEEEEKEEEKTGRFSAATTDESIMGTYTKVFGGLNMNGLISEFVINLKKKNYDESFITELMLETGESSSQPNLKLMQAIAERWIKEGIYSRRQSKEQKERRVKHAQSQGHFEKGIQPGGNSAESEFAFLDR